MYMFVCGCICVCWFVCICVCVFVCMYVYMNACMYIHMVVCIYILCTSAAALPPFHCRCPPPLELSTLPVWKWALGIFGPLLTVKWAKCTRGVVTLLFGCFPDFEPPEIDQFNQKRGQICFPGLRQGPKEPGARPTHPPPGGHQP